MNENAKQVEAAVIGCPYGRSLGLVCEKVEKDFMSVRLPYRDDLTTVPGIVHGGAIASLVDAAATGAFWSSAKVEPGSRGTTIGFSIQYLSAGTGDLIAEARVVRRGGSVCTGQVEVRGPKGELVALATVSYKLSALKDPLSTLAGFFEGKSVPEQMALLASLERVGGSMYERWKKGERDPERLALLDAASEREEANAQALESILRR